MEEVLQDFFNSSFFDQDFWGSQSYRDIHETSVVIIQACIITFVAGAWIAILCYRSALKSQSAAFFWCGNFAIVFSLWNLFFLSSYAQRDIEIWNSSLSNEFALRAYLGLGALIPSFAHACIRRVYQSRYLVTNRIHVISFLTAIVAFFAHFSKQELTTLLVGVVSFSALATINWKIWRRYRRAQEARLKTKSLFLGVGMTTVLLFSLIGQLRAENWIRLPLPYLGNILTIIFIYFIYQMIGNPRLREVRELMLRGVRVFFLSVILSTIFILLVSWVGASDPELFLFNTFLGSFIILMILDPLRKQIDSFIMKRLIVDSAEFEKALQNLLRKVRRTRSSKDLFSTLNSGLGESARVYKSGVYVWDPTAMLFRATADSTLNTPQQLSAESGMVRYFTKRKAAVLKESAEDSESIRLLRELRAHLAFSIFQGEDLIAIWAIRTSLAGESAYTSFTNSEIDLLARVALEVSTILDQVNYFERMESQQRLAALGEMSAALAHEIRNPLGAIQGAAMLLESSPTLSHAEDRECILILKSELERLQQTVDQYLHFARKTETLVESDLRIVTQKAIRSADAKAQKTRTKVHFEPGEKAINILTDPLKLEQVLINLIQNACEAFCKNVRISILDQEQELEILVSDDGPGIPIDVLPNIFTPLFTTKKAGSGLGLPICKKIVDSLNGELRVQSQVGTGTTFSIRLKKNLEVKAAG